MTFDTLTKVATIEGIIEQQTTTTTTTCKQTKTPFKQNQIFQNVEPHAKLVDQH